MATKLKATPQESYDADFYVWVLDQAEILRTRRVEALDLENLIEEVDDLGGALKRSVRSRIGTIIEHFLKLEHSPAQDLRGGWYDDIITQRRDLVDELTPSLRREVEPDLVKLYARARGDAATSLRRHGGNSAADALPADPPYTFDQITGDWLP